MANEDKSKGKDGGKTPSDAEKAGGKKAPVDPKQQIQPRPLREGYEGPKRES
jgi:hypothetical protein